MMTSANRLVLLNRFLIGIILLLLILIGVKSAIFTLSRNNYKGNNYKIEIIEKTISPIISVSKPEDTSVSFKPISYYTEVKSGRLFKPPTIIIKTPSPSKPLLPEINIERPNLILKGIIWGPQDAVAVIKEIYEQEAHQVTVGDEISDWKVIKILKNSVTLRKNGEEIILHLQYEGTR